ncbi:MAG: LCP family protein [Oscillospiraceae bacterium]|nr:LCP family protein [Oscillospiraceae bacterium]
MAQKKKKKKSRGHVAIPFLLTLLIGIVGLGGIAMYVFTHLSINQETTVEWNSTVKKPTAADNMTILFILHEERDPKPLTFMIARLLPADKHVMFISFPANMLAVVDGRSDTLEGFFNGGGVASVKAAIENEAHIKTDRYAILGSDGFQKICNIFGGVYYRVPNGIKGFEDTLAPQYLGPHQMEKLVTYPFFDQGESQRSATAADMMTEMINVTDSDRDRLLASMDNNFKMLVNLMETDITAQDYNDHKSALRYMYTYGKNIGMFRLVTGEPGESDVYLLSGDFYRSVQEYFAEDAQPSPSEGDSEDASAEDSAQASDAVPETETEAGAE